MGPQEPTKWNTLLQKWLFYDIKQASILFSKEYLSKEGLIVWFSTFACFFSKIHHTTQTVWCWVPSDPRIIFQATSFIFLALRFHIFFHFYAREHMVSNFYLKWIEFTKSYEFPIRGVRFIHIRVKILE